MPLIGERLDHLPRNTLTSELEPEILEMALNMDYDEFTGIHCPCVAFFLNEESRTKTNKPYASSSALMVRPLWFGTDSAKL